MIKKMFFITAIIAIIILTGFIVLTKYSINRSLPPDISKIMVVDLSDPQDSKFVVYETDRVVIKFGLIDFKEHLVDSHRDSIKNQLVYFIEEQEKNLDEIDISNKEKIISFIKKETDKQFDPRDLRYDLEYHIAHLLETGSYSLFDKDENSYLSKIEVGSYSVDNYVYKVYLLPKDDTVFFKVLGMIGQPAAPSGFKQFFYWLISPFT